MQTFFKTLLLFMFFAIPALANAETTMTAALSSMTARIGDIINLSISIKYPANSASKPHLEVAPLSLRNEANTTWTLIDSPTVSSKVIDGNNVEDHIYHIAAYKLGTLDMPRVVLEYYDIDNKTTQSSIDLPPVTINASPNMTVNTEFLSFKPPVDLGWPKWFITTLVFIIIILVILLFLILTLFFKRKVLPIMTTPLSMDAWALKELGSLEKSDLVQTKQFKLFFSKISDILRLYVAKSFNIPALDMTTGEILDQLNEQNMISNDAFQTLKEVLDEADLVKFAKFIPNESKCSLSIEKSKQFIQLTTLNEVTPTKVLDSTSQMKSSN